MAADSSRTGLPRRAFPPTRMPSHCLPQRPSQAGQGALPLTTRRDRVFRKPGQQLSWASKSHRISQTCRAAWGGPAEESTFHGSRWVQWGPDQSVAIPVALQRPRPPAHAAGSFFHCKCCLLPAPCPPVSRWMILTLQRALGRPVAQHKGAAHVATCAVHPWHPAPAPSV